MVTLTDIAAERIRDIIKETPDAQGKALRLFVEGGGCAGFQYGFTFDDKHDDDSVTQLNGFELAIDPISASYLVGVTIDYVESLQGAGFKIDNPNAAGGSITSITLILAINGWMVYARMTRGVVLSVRERPFVEAAEIVGCNDLGAPQTAADEVFGAPATEATERKERFHDSGVGAIAQTFQIKSCRHVAGQIDDVLGLAARLEPRAGSRACRARHLLALRQRGFVYRGD